MVKTKYAKKYSIPTTYPDDLKQFVDTTPPEILLSFNLKRSVDLNRK